MQGGVQDERDKERKKRRNEIGNRVPNLELRRNLECEGSGREGKRERGKLRVKDRVKESARGRGKWLRWEIRNRDLLTWDLKILG